MTISSSFRLPRLGMLDLALKKTDLKSNLVKKKYLMTQRLPKKRKNRIEKMRNAGMKKMPKGLRE